MHPLSCHIATTLLTLMHVHSENGMVARRSNPARRVRMNAHRPGPSGAAPEEEEEEEMKRITKYRKDIPTNIASVNLVIGCFFLYYSSTCPGVLTLNK